MLLCSISTHCSLSFNRAILCCVVAVTIQDLPLVKIKHVL